MRKKIVIPACLRRGSRNRWLDSRLKLAGMTVLLFLTACSPTYKKETYQQSIRDLAKKEYKLDVEVAENGKTLGLRYRVPNLINEMTSGDDTIYKQMNGLFMILARVALSADISPDFIVLDISDQENPQFRVVFTRYVEDLKKSFADALSYTDNQDRLLEEFIVGKKRVTFDPQDMDLVRFMMMAMDAPEPKTADDYKFKLEDVKFPEFIAKVMENTLRRVLREDDKVNKEVQLRQVSASFTRTSTPSNLHVMLDLVSAPAAKPAPKFIDSVVFPRVMKEVSGVMKSYRFQDFAAITVIEKNSGKIVTTPR